MMLRRSAPRWRATAATRRAHALVQPTCHPRAVHHLFSTNARRLASNSLHNDTPPGGHDRPDITVWNSLTARAEHLPRGEAVTPHVLRWYACGPTVYDRAHLGHARSYVCQDILRRVLEHRLGFHVFLVMGVTDVDDKIITRAQEDAISVTSLARKQERTFFQDMARLHVRAPTAVTRVSEHMEEIIAYIAAIQANGLAYEATDGSGVYFDTQRLGGGYGKLAPSRQHAEAYPSASVDGATAGGEDAGEETMSTNTTVVGKRDRRDFALWKTAKNEHEPSWPSPWGQGRPGWHIECSAMTHHVLGRQLDVHSGGIDLQFPHHNNEIAQCDAHNRGCCPSHRGGVDGNSRSMTGQEEEKEEWCRHFIHFGHLYIQGRKMSKSLKNFISVQDFLEQHDADDFRWFCLQYKYRASLHYSEDRVRDAAVVSHRVRNFLRNLETHGPGHTESTDPSIVEDDSKRCGPPELALLATLFDARVAFDAALCDDFDTPRALSHMLEVVGRANEYLLHRAVVDDATVAEAVSRPPVEVLGALAAFVLDVLHVFGVEGLHNEFAHLRDYFQSAPASDSCTGDSQARTSLLGVGARSTESQVVDPEQLARSLMLFRAAVRQQALQDPGNPAMAQILQLCDSVRDRELLSMGLQIEDVGPGRSVMKWLTQQERDALMQTAKDEQARHEQMQASRLAQQEAWAAVMQIAPRDLFTNHSDYNGLYAQFDDDGVPTHALGGDELSKSQRKKLRKKLDKHAKAYEKYWQQHGDSE